MAEAESAGRVLAYRLEFRASLGHKQIVSEDLLGFRVHHQFELVGQDAPEHALIFAALVFRHLLHILKELRFPSAIGRGWELR